MNLDEAIFRFETASSGLSGTECGAYNSQIASFLKELKYFRKKYPNENPNPYVDFNFYPRSSGKLTSDLDKSIFPDIKFSK